MTLLSNSNKITDLKEVNEIEEKLQEFSNLLVTDLINRENFITDLSLFIADEKSKYFSYLDSK